MYHSLGTNDLTWSLERSGLKTIDWMSLVRNWINLGANHMNEAGQRTQIKQMLWIFLRCWCVMCVFKLGCWRITTIWICDCHNYVGINILHAYIINQNEQLIWQSVSCPTSVYCHVRYESVPWGHHIYSFHLWWIRKHSIKIFFTWLKCNTVKEVVNISLIMILLVTSFGHAIYYFAKKTIFTTK